MGKPRNKLDQILSDIIVTGSMVGIGILVLVISLKTEASYIYEANQSLYDLQTNSSGSTGLGSNDDAVSGAFNIGFTFDFYGQSFTQARMATNGCLHFKTSGAYCNDFTPDPLSGQHTYTLYPFWTDLIKDNGSGMRAKAFADYTIFGWYKMREYNEANTDNSFEVWLYPNDTFEFRYGGLDIDRHDVLIGEIGSGSKEVYQYYFHDECNTGSTNASNCVNTNWNDTSTNNLLENGGSLYGAGSGNGIDCTDALNNVNCPNYENALFDYNCQQDTQHDIACPGYRLEDSYAYYNEEEFDYGYEEEFNYDDDPYANMDFTDEEWYEIDRQEFGQEQVDDWYGAEVQFSNDGTVVWDTTPHTSYDDVDMLLQEYDEQVVLSEIETYEILSFDALPVLEDLPELFVFETLIREELENENIEEIEREEFETMEELEEWFEEELAEAEDIIEEQQVAENREEVLTEEDRQEERREEAVEEDFAEELFAEEEEGIPNQEKSSVSRSALSVVASTIRTANNSSRTSGAGYSGSGSVTNTSSASNSSSGVSTSNSPSMSDQIASATVQTNQILSMSSGGTGNVSVFVTPMPNVDNNPQIVMAEVQVQDMQGDIDTAVSGVMTASEADQIADQIVAQNIKSQKEEAEEEQQETGKYGDESTLVAYLGYVPSFEAYKIVSIPQVETWYEPRTVYEDVYIPDNITAFYGLASSNFNRINSMIGQQPNL